MLDYAEPVTKLIDEFKRLPSIGQKSAQRLAFHILRSPDAEVERLIQARRPRQGEHDDEGHRSMPPRGGLGGGRADRPPVTAQVGYDGEPEDDPGGQQPAQPVVLEGVHIGAGARLVDCYIGPYTAIGADCTIERAEVEHSILLDGCTVTDLDVLAVGNCYLRKEDQDPALKQNYETAFELD
jgi:hypothetical protein